MKILIHSNSPRAHTGYGIQTAHLARSLKAAGHDVAISAYYGQQTGIGEWEGIKLYPVGAESYGNDILHEHALHHFGGDPLGGWVIPIMDVFGLKSPLLKNFNVAAWTPVDHYPCPPEVLDFFSQTGAVPIAMSRYGEKLLAQAGLDPLYAPLTVDTTLYQPTATVDLGQGPRTGREMLGATEDQFVVFMNGMNKGNAIHRKGFPQAFLAFGKFAAAHPDAILCVHAELTGFHAQGIDLAACARAYGIPAHQLSFPDQYAYRIGIPAEYLAAAYTAADVLLAPSMGEGFCVPLIEAQACGTPVIVTDFSAQPELLGAGWTVTGQPWWEAAQTSSLIDPYIGGIECQHCGQSAVDGIIEQLERAYEARGDEMLSARARKKAADYETRFVFAEYWEPILEELDPDPPRLARPKISGKDAVAVLVPVLTRPENVAPMVESFRATQRGVANIYFVCDPGDDIEIAAVKDAGAEVLISERGSTFAQKINSGYEQTTEPWIFVAGDDVRFHNGWIDAARNLSDRFDVIGTNDHPDGQGNVRVAQGAHADHFFVRRTYIDTYGASLGGLVCHEGYQHLYVDMEIIELAKNRRVFTPCLDSLVEHLHPGLGHGEADDVYRQGWATGNEDRERWEQRRPLVEMQRVGRGKTR